MKIITSFVGQLVHKNVAAEMEKKLKDMGVVVDMPWPKGTVFESEQSPADSKYWSHRASGPWGSRSTLMAGEQSPFREESQDVEWFVNIDRETHNVTASGSFAGGGNKPIKVDLGPLSMPIAPFCLTWDDADMIVQSNEVWAIGWWFAPDLIEWLETRKLEVIQDHIEKAPESRPLVGVLITT